MRDRDNLRCDFYLKGYTRNDLNFIGMLDSKLQNKVLHYLLVLNKSLLNRNDGYDSINMRLYKDFDHGKAI